MIQKQKHKQSYQLRFLSLYNSPLSLLPFHLSKKIILDEVLLNIFNTNTILSSLYIQSTIENNVYQIYLTKSPILKNRKRFKNRKKNSKKVFKSLNRNLNIKEIINLLNRSFTYINSKKSIFEIYSVKSLVLEPSILANWMQFQLLKNRIKIFFLMKKVTKTFLLVLKTKNNFLKQKILSYNLKLKTILLIILVWIVIRSKKWVNDINNLCLFNKDFQYSTLNFQEVNNKFSRFFKIKKIFRRYIDINAIQAKKKKEN